MRRTVRERIDLGVGARFVEQPGLTPPPRPNTRRAERLLLLLFLLSLPFLNPWVRGDGVGYYAFVRAPLIEHNLDFTKDYQHANESFRGPRLDESGRPKSAFRTPTGHLDHHFTVGQALLWTPFLLLAHAAVLLARALGSTVAADGFSTPYRVTMALATALYGFLGLLLAFRLARQYVEERWAFLATLSIWWASSLPVYMYFNPSWSHAHSAFAVALFLWYWHETRSSRSPAQWLILALIAGLMLNIYYANAMVLAVLVVEALPQYLAAFRRDPRAACVDAYFFSRHRWTHPFLAARAARRRCIPRRIPGFLLSHCLLPGLGGNFFLRQPFFRFADAALHSRPRCFPPPLRAIFPLPQSRACRRFCRPRGLRPLERRPHVPVGFASCSRARPGLLFGGAPQSILRCASPAHFQSARLPLPAKSPHAAD